MAGKSQTELFKVELETLLKKYPTVRFNVEHAIQIVEVPKPNEEKQEKDAD